MPHCDSVIGEGLLHVIKAVAEFLSETLSNQGGGGGILVRKS